MGFTLSRQVRMLSVLLVFSLLAGCLGINSPTMAIEEAVATFQQSIQSGDYEGYQALVTLFADTFVLEDESTLQGFNILMGYWYEEFIPGILENPEEDQLYGTNDYFKDKLDAVIAIYVDKGRDLDDPEVDAAIREYAEEFILLEYAHIACVGLYRLEHETIPDEFLELVFELFVKCEFLGDAFRLPREVVNIFMNSDVVWEEAVIEQNGNEWIAELPFIRVDEEDGDETGVFILTFRKLSGKWKITKVHTERY